MIKTNTSGVESVGLKYQQVLPKEIGEQEITSTLSPYGSTYIKPLPQYILANAKKKCSKD